MRFGAAYYPEHWPRERWPIDARMMQAAHFNTVRLAEFAWTRLEPDEDAFDFGWLDDAMELLGAHGVQTLLCTPTATPPAWVVEQSPDILPITPDGKLVNFGGRRHYCPTQTSYREHTARIVHAMGQHYATHPHVIAWQIDNELAGHVDQCYCDACQQAFQQWVQAQYGSLDAVNEAWGTDFWSEVFTDWTQIPAPRYMHAQHSPSLVLAWKRFYTDVWTDYFLFQKNLLRESGVTVPITTNLMGLFRDLDYYTHARALDFVAWDNYPNNYPAPAGKYESAFAHDLMRSVKDGKPYWVVEEQSGAPGWNQLGGRTGPGYMRLMTYQAIAHGGEGILYFRWRTCRFGVEQYWHGILQHDGRPNWRYAEVTRTGQELRALPDDLFTARTPTPVALLYSHDQLWAHGIISHVPGFDYVGEQLPIYGALREAGVDVDMVNEESDLTPYRVLIAPAWQLLPADTAEAVIDFVRHGGTLVLTYRSAVKDWDSVIWQDPLPGPLRDLLGITVDDYDALGVQQATVGVHGCGSFPLPAGLTGTLWADVITAEGADTEATFADGWYAGRPAITVNRFGDGQAWYIGTHLDSAFWQSFLKELLAQAHLPSADATSDGVEIAHRQGERRYTFVLNMQQIPGWVELAGTQTDLLTGDAVGPGKVALEPFGVRILT